MNNSTLAFIHFLPASFLYPIKGRGKFFLLGYMLILFLMHLLKAIPVIAFLPWLIVQCLFIYIYSYMAKVIANSAAGLNEPPDWPDVTNCWCNILLPFLRILGAGLISFIPALIIHFLSIYSVMTFSYAFWALIITGFLYFPIALLAVILYDSWKVLNPIFLLRSVAKIWLSYILACILLAAVAITIYFTIIRFSIPYLDAFLFYYLQILSMRIIGLLYYTHSKQLDWFRI